MGEFRSSASNRILGNLSFAFVFGFIVLNGMNTNIVYAAVLDSVNFEDGTFGSLSPDSGITIVPVSNVPELVGSGHGNVAQMTYNLTAGPGGASKDLAIRAVHRTMGFGQTLFFKGDFYLDAYIDHRKLFRMDSNTGARNTWIVISAGGSSNGEDSLSMETRNGGVLVAWAPGVASIPLNTWNTIEFQVTVNGSPTTSDGVYRIWFNGTLAYEKTGFIMFTDPLSNFDMWSVGDQMSAPPNTVETDTRYWDNITFSTTRGGGTPPPSDAIAPSTPGNLAPSAVYSSQIDLTWTASTDNVGVAGYRIFRNGAFIRIVTGPNYSDRGLSASTAYTYSVTAYDTSGNFSTPSAPVTIQTLAPGVNPTTTGPSASSITAYPNPWRSDRHSGIGVTFANLPRSSTLKIFTVSGHLVKTLNSTGGSATWDLSNDTGSRVASGTYLYAVKAAGTGEVIKGKLGVIR